MTRPTELRSSLYWAVVTETTPDLPTALGERTDETSALAMSMTSRCGSWSLNTE